MARGTEERRSVGATMLGAGSTVTEVAAKLRVTRQTVWRWMQAEEFQALRAEVRRAVADEVVTESVAELRLLAPEAIEALARGVRSDKDSLAVHSADLLLKRLREFEPRSGLDVELSASAQLTELIGRLDAHSGPRADAPAEPAS